MCTFMYVGCTFMYVGCKMRNAIPTCQMVCIVLMLTAMLLSEPASSSHITIASIVYIMATSATADALLWPHSLHLYKPGHEQRMWLIQDEQKAESAKVGDISQSAFLV